MKWSLSDLLNWDVANLKADVQVMLGKRMAAAFIGTKLESKPRLSAFCDSAPYERAAQNEMQLINIFRAHV